MSNNRKCIGWPKNSYATIKSFEELFSRKVSLQICALNLRWRGKTEEEDELGGILRRVARLVVEM